MDANGIKILVDLLTLAHLHITRATVPTQVGNWLSFDDILQHLHGVAVMCTRDIASADG